MVPLRGMSWRSFLSIGSLLVALAGCENTVDVVERPCEVAADCAPSEACVRGLCVSLGDDGGPFLGTLDGGTSTPACTLADEASTCGQGRYCTSEGACADLPTCASGQACPEGLSCDEEAGLCRRPDAGCVGSDCGCTEGSCDDGLFCNGQETCDEERGNCEAGAPPCGGATPVCDEDNDACVECLDSLDCPGFFDECIENQCVCVPDCAGRACGDDGCGGSCGECESGLCGDDGICGCVPDCTGKACGSDGCGGSCGECQEGKTCDEQSFQCVCQPDCTGKACGDDGCGGSCGECPEALQACDASGQCVYVGDVCDALTDVLDIEGYETKAGSLSELADQIYAWDDRPERYLDNFLLTNVSAGQRVTIDLTGPLDTYLYVYDVGGGQCSLVAKNDDVDLAGGNRNSRVAITVGSGTYQIVATTYGERVTGDYTLSTRADLCGIEVDAKATYDKCKPRVDANPNATNGPCGHNWCVDYGNSAEFCCITQSCRDGYGTGNVITIQKSAAVCNP